MRGKIRLNGRANYETKKGFPIIIYLTKDKKEKEIITGYHSKKNHWNKPNALPTNKHPQYIELLNYLETIKIKLRKVLEEAKYDNISLDYAQQKLLKKDNSIFFNDAMKLAVNLKRTYKIALVSFNKYFPDYPYDYITKEVAEEYMHKLSKTPVNGKKRSPNGVLSYMSSLNAIWNKLGKKNNPFSGVRVERVPTKSKALLDSDLVKMRENKLKDYYGSNAGKKHYVNFLMLCFYLGGIDMIDLRNATYDDNVVNGRFEYTRTKLVKKVSASNFIFPEARAILDQYDCKPYLVPLFKLKNYDSYISNMSRTFQSIKDELQLSKKPYSKAARYTFINRAQNLLIDERITISIVAHSQSSTHSIYKDEFPKHIQDEAHKKIISF